MFYPLKTALLGIALALSTGFAAEAPPDPPWKFNAWDLESGVLWNVGTGTPFAYRFLQTQVSWRSKEFLGWELNDGSRLVVRHRMTLIGAAVQSGPEAHYLGFSGSPSVELWNRASTCALFTSAGGGFGAIDSRGIKGGQGQDFTLNWFARGGIEYVASRNLHVTATVMFQHLSNGGQTKPNPGIDAVGFMLGCTWVR